MFFELAAVPTSQNWPKPMQMLLGIAVDNWVLYPVVAGIAWVLGSA